MKQGYIKTFQNKIVSCSVCNCSMTQTNYYKHKKTEKHKINLEKVSSQDFVKMNEVIMYLLTAMILKNERGNLWLVVMIPKR